MYYSKIDPMSIVDGKGNRVTLFVSGCRNHCPECFNPDTWNFNYGQPYDEIVENEILEAVDHTYMAGITLLGGEPFEEENQPVLLGLIKKFKERCPEKNLWMYTGYVLEKDLVPGGRKYVPGVTDAILDEVDVLVDGPYMKELRDISDKNMYRGSTNQRLLYKKTDDMSVSIPHLRGKEA